MDVTLLARLQFAVTTVYHFFFVPLTLGLSILVAVMQTIYFRTGDETYKKMTKFWGKLFLINFALGVVTGIVQEFQFGMNWSEYSRFVGDIFGAPLAIEALLAFFLESTFLGLWIFGWDRVSKRVHLASIWLAAIGANISAFWILLANAFMQQPLGFVLQNGRAEMNDFLSLLFNPTLWKMFPHTFYSGLATAAFFIMGISAYHLVRKSNPEMFRRSFQIGAIVAILGSLLVALTGHSQMQHLVETQPMKVAAAEALWNTENPAALSLFTVGNERERRDVFAIRLPFALSILAFNQLYGTVEGINNLQESYTAAYGPGDYVPPVAISYWSFRIMVGAGTLMVLLAFYAIFLVMGEQLTQNPPRLLGWFTLAIGLPYLANSAGWILTEVGRQPWVVHGLMRVETAVSPNVTAGMLLTSLIGFTLIYGILAAADVYLITKFARAGGAKLEAQPADEPRISLIPGD